MSRKLVKKDLSALEELPLFREPEVAGQDAAEDAAGEDGSTSPEELDAALESLDVEAPGPIAVPAPRERDERAPIEPPANVHGLWFALGIVLAVVGLASAVFGALRPPALANVLEACNHMGATPTLLLGFAIVCFGVATVLRRQVQQVADMVRLDEALREVLTVTDQVDATTRTIHANDAARAASAAAGDEFGRVLFALQRNEEKLVNLTKATKTFGKPLVEMTTQLADVAAQAAQVQTGLQALRVSSESGANRAEEMLRKLGENRATPELEELRRGFEELRTNLQRELRAQPEALQRAVQGLVQGATTTLEGSLASNKQALQTALGALQEELKTQLSALEKATKEGGGKGKDVSVNLTPIQTAIADLRRDLANLANLRAAAPAASTAPVAAAPAAPAAPAASASDDPPPPSGLAHSIAGERASKGTNVLGAIAKLKKLRG